MTPQTLPASRDLVLVGGGHTHALFLNRWSMDPLPGVRLTLIDPAPAAAYSGMLPGHVAGHYTRDALDIDLVRLARRADARLVLGAAEALDPVARRIRVAGRPDIAYDVASLDVGITSAMPDLPGFSDHAVPAKPLGPFASAWARYRAGSSPARIAVIGGGVAGAELSMAMAHALRQDNRPAEITLIDNGRALAALGPAAARRVRASLTTFGIRIIDHARPLRVTDQGVEVENQRPIAADFVTGAAGARPHRWIAASGLADPAGFVPVDGRLRSADPGVFAAGDCAEMRDTPRPKAGVYAVRQAPVLFHNLRATLAGTGGLRRYRPQTDYLKLVSLGEKSALAERFGIAVSGPLLWRWKDRIDRRFMDKFHTPPRAAPPVLPWPRAQGAGDALGDKPMCGGCGAKVGGEVLRRALRASGAEGTGDDAAVLDTGGARQVISTDHLRAMVADPVVMTRIAVQHALGDVWAMGAQPQAALAAIILPRQSPELAERALFEIMQTARETFAAAGAEVVGGHSTQGAEMTIGFTVTGLCARAPITLAGARPGDSLVLTKPIGSGVIMAAEMQGRARGADVAAALEWMARPQGDAAHALGTATAMTDVTGFGLAGHLRAMCRASGVGAVLDAKRVPLMQGALDLARAGVRSTLFPANRAGFEHVDRNPLTDLMFDPQTGGGLLAAMQGDPVAVLAALAEGGIPATVIGHVTADAPGQIEIV